MTGTLMCEYCDDNYDPREDQPTRREAEMDEKESFGDDDPWVNPNSPIHEPPF